ncbi:glycosyltransferase family 4 protein [Temperatibacter marinus]|uniref:Glycosyltransferase family 4 protein n=1 Tax=Temperatibacter marinus TaxID=1456591 RepID=A0AA52EI03_9PROT|nr:glycosyltransferase family 4 protein [Temperatibacter marinus]WND02669.1 glycosyltransferase family 4 protein [Temperatibacter marinus]
MSDILHIFSTFEVGGPQRRFIDLIRMQMKGEPNSFKHHILALDGCYDAYALLPEESKGAQVIKVEPPDLSRGLVKNILTIKAFLSEHKASQILTYNWGSIEWSLAARFCSKKSYIHVQDGFGPEEQSSQIFRRKVFRRLGYGGRCKIIVPSHYLKEMALKTWGRSLSSLCYIPNGIDLERYSIAPEVGLRKELSLHADHCVIGTVCAMRPEKNIGRLIEAFSLVEKDYPNARLLLVGDGMALPAMKMLAERIGLKEKILFAGHQTQPERYSCLFDIFALSSDTEQMPLAVLESMAAGKVIAATDVGDVSTMVAAENRPYIYGKSAKILAQNLGQLVATKAVLSSIGEKNKEKAFADFSDAQMYKKWAQIYSESKDR